MPVLSLHTRARVCVCVHVHAGAHTHTHTHTYMYLGIFGVLRYYVVKPLIKNVLMFERNTEPSSARASRS